MEEQDTRAAKPRLHQVESTAETRGSRPKETCPREPQRGRPEAGERHSKRLVLPYLSVPPRTRAGITSGVVVVIVVGGSRQGSGGWSSGGDGEGYGSGGDGGGGYGSGGDGGSSDLGSGRVVFVVVTEG